jgi:2-polyprenyl-3-methyl-5-hydroxy-6-metoxy-1,4-benzoquinol methylase
MGNSGAEDRDLCFSLAGDSPCDILDLGCGTGLVCDAFAARGHNVTGADPAPAMLDVARSKPHGASVEWVEATAEGFRSPKRFDLIIMTGHAFQVLLTDAQVAEALANMAAHLKPLWLRHIRKPQSGYRLGQRLGPRTNAAIAGRHADPRVSLDHRVQPRHRHDDLRVGL